MRYCLSYLPMLCAAPLMYSTAQAGAFSCSGQSQLSSDYDDNVNLAVDDPVASWNRIASVSGDLGYRHDTFAWDFAPRIQIVRYAESPLLDRSDSFLTTTLGRITERASTQLEIDGVQDTTLTSELGLTGLTQTNKRHRNVSGTLTQTWQASQLTAINLQGGWSASRYVDAAYTGLINYNYATAAVNVQSAISALTSLTVGVNAGQLRVPHIHGYDKLNVNGSVGLIHALKDNASLTISAGPSLLRSDTQTDHGYVYAAKYAWKRERANFSFGLSRTVAPTGYGALSRQDELDLSWYQPITERWFSSVSLTGVRNHYALASGGLSLYTVDYGAFTGTLGWHLTPTVDVNLSVGYATQRITHQADQAERRHAALTVSWSGLTNTLN